MALSTSVFVLTFWGEEQIVNVFSNVESAIDYAFSELRHQRDLSDEEIVIFQDPDSIREYTIDKDVSVVISDPDQGDWFYTVSEVEMNPTFKV